MAGSTIDTWVWLALIHLLITVITSIGRKAVAAVCPYEVLQTTQGREKPSQQTAAKFGERGGVEAMEDAYIHYKILRSRRES